MAWIETTTFLVALRESLEAFLILSILTGLVVKLGRPEAKRPLLWGALAGLAVSILAGVIIHATVLGLYETHGVGEYVEGVASLLAVGILTYMVVWMYRHTLGMVDEMRKRAHAALDAGRNGVLFALAFIAVVREGLETVLLVAARAAEATAASLALSVLVGIAVSAVAAWLLFSGIVRLNIQKFFAASGLLLIVFAAGLLATGVHEFSEVGLVPETRTAWDTEALLDQHSTVGAVVKAIFGYRERPTVLEATAYFTYLLVLGLWYLRGMIHATRPGRATPAHG